MAVTDPNGLDAGFDDAARAPNPDVAEVARAPKPEALNALSEVCGWEAVGVGDLLAARAANGDVADVLAKPLPCGIYISQHLS